MAPTVFRMEEIHDELDRLESAATRAVRVFSRMKQIEQAKKN